MAKRKRLNIRRLIVQSDRILKAYERKYQRIFNAEINKQLKHYVDTNEFIDTITPAIEQLYREVGERYFMIQRNIFIDSLEKSVFMNTFRAWFEVYLKTQIANKVTNINETTLNRLQQTLSTFIRGSFEWEEAVSTLTTHFDFSPRRALMIARTEIGNANNVAKQKSSDEWQLETGDQQYKIWIHRGSKAPREWHQHLDNGRAIPKDIPFVVTDPNTGIVDYMTTPHDPNASAGNVINCGCEVIYVSERYARENNMID